MNTLQIASTFRARRVGKGKYKAKCPSHGRDRSASLYITERADGSTGVHCFAGCDVRDVLAAVGLRLSDLFADSKAPDPFWAQQKRDREHLALLERQEGLAIMAQAVFPDEREHWAEVESTVALEERELQDKLNPSEAVRREREAEVQRIIAEYGFDELVNCLPKGTFQP